MTLPIYDEEVRAEAACEQWSTRLFWPEARGGPGQVPSTRAEADYMLRVYEGCPVQSLCLTVKPDNAVGVYGGYLFGELSRAGDTYVPTVIKKRHLEPRSRPGTTPPPPPPRPQPERKTDLILRLVTQHPGITTAELAKLTRFTPNSANTTVTHLSRQGKVRRSVEQQGRVRRAHWYAASATRASRPRLLTRAATTDFEAGSWVVVNPRAPRADPR